MAGPEATASRWSRRPQPHGTGPRLQRRRDLLPATGRNDLTVRVNRDDGASWPEAALLKPGASGYSTTAVLADGSVGDLYEVGNTGGIVFTRFTLPWIES